MAMKNTAFLLLLLVLFSCKNEKGIPDVSDVKADVRVERFDKEFFALDTANIEQGLGQLTQKFPEMTPLFLQYILGLDNADIPGGVKHFLRLSGPIRDTVNTVFKNTQDVEQDFLQAFRYVKYYFPEYQVPKVITVVGPVDALAQGSNGPTPNFLRPEFLGISLQFYLGRNFSVYNDPMFIEAVVPTYRSRRFSKEYITADAMQLVVDNLFPDSSNDKPLVEQMIEKGKRWWLLDKFMPHTPDSIKTGYTQQQLSWCKENEGLIWTFILRQEDLYATKPAIIQNYIGEAPFTQGFSQELSPGNLGQWIGWQIVQKYVSKNPGKSIEEVMKTPASKILDDAKYKPK
jgi:hypothetical protein